MQVAIDFFLLADFDQGVCDFFGFQADDLSELLESRTPGLPIERSLQMTINDIYGSIDRTGKEFWMGLKKRTNFAKLVQLARLHSDRKPMVVGFYPILKPHVASGMIRWCNSHFLKNTVGFTFTTDLGSFPNKETLFLTDRESYASRVQEAGDNALLVPSMWNSRHEQTPMAMEIVRNELAKWVLCVQKERAR